MQLLTVASNVKTKNSVTIKYVYIYLLELNLCYVRKIQSLFNRYTSSHIIYFPCFLPYSFPALYLIEWYVNDDV
jgi:hypothetical protein